MAAEPESATRTKILDAMSGLMTRYGFRKTTMEDVSREARVSRRTIYMHFESKEAVGLACLERVAGDLQTEMAQQLEGDGHSPDLLRNMLSIRVMGRVKAFQDYSTSLDELFESVRPEYRARRATAFEKERALIVRVLERGVSDGLLEARRVQAVASSLLLATDAFIPYGSSVVELGTTATIRARLESMVELLLECLSPRIR